MFLTSLNVTSDPSGDWVLAAPLRYRTDGGRMIEVPTGYPTDLFTIPPFARALFDTDGPGREASVVHDYIYTHLTHRYTRAEADRIFRQGLAERGVGWCERWTMWAAVRAGGEGNW